MPYIVIDAGHGGRDAGNCFFGLSEKDVALSAATKVSNRLRELGFSVTELRQGDEEIGSASARGKEVAKLKPDFALSFHVNSTEGRGTKSGMEIIVPLGKTCTKFESALKSSLLGLGGLKCIYSKEARSQNILERQLRTEGCFLESFDSPDYFGIIREAWAGGVELDIIELFYLDNESDVQNFREKEAQYVEAIVLSLAQAFGMADVRHEQKAKKEPLKKQGAASPYYRVVCGAYADLEEAKKVQNYLQKQFPNAWIQGVGKET